MIKNRDKLYSSPEKSKIWSITTPKEAAIVTKAAYGDGAITEIRHRKMQALQDSDFSRGSFWQEAENILKTNDTSIEEGVKKSRIKVEQLIQLLRQPKTVIIKTPDEIGLLIIPAR